MVFLETIKLYLLAGQMMQRFKVNTIPDYWFPWQLLPEYGYLWWLPERGYLAFGYGGQFIAVVPELDLVIGTHSTDNEGFNV